MTNNNADLRYDPEGILPTEGDVQAFSTALGKTNSVVISELNEEQFKIISDGILRAMSPDPRNRMAKFCGKLAFLAFTMVFVAVCVWTVALIVANLPTR